MDPKLIAAVAGNTARICERSVVLCTNSKITIVLGQEIRTQTRQLRHQSLQERERHGTTRLKSIIARKLRGGRLPWVSPASISGGPGQGGICDACEQTLAPGQLVMAVPAGEKGIIHLHADCFMLWNALRHLPPAGSAHGVGMTGGSLAVSVKRSTPVKEET